MPKSKVNWWLMLIVGLGLFIRIYGLNSLPYGTHADEASWGYNAYSVLKTGRDERGVRFPLIFEAFGDQKLPVFTYSVVPFVKIFGLNNLAVRLPAVLIGTLTILAVYWLLKKLRFTETASLFGALTVAISPWAIFLSRIFSFDSTFGLFFFCLALVSALHGQKTGRLSFLILSAILFGFTWYCYIAYRLVSSLILLVIVFVFFRNKFLIKKPGVIMLITFLLTITPLLLVGLKGKGNARFSQVISTPLLGMTLEINENRFYCSQVLPQTLCKLVDNKGDSYLRTLGYRFSKLFSPNYLFLEGEPNYPFMNVAHYGLFPFLLIPFYFVGFATILRKFLKKKADSTDLFLLFGLVFTPLAALLVNDAQKVRLSALLPFLIIVLVIGYHETEKYLGQKNRFKLAFITSGMLILWLGSFMVDFLVIHLPKNDFHYQNHVVKLAQYLGTLPRNKEIYIRGIDEVIVYYAFVNKVDPRYYQKNVKRETRDEIGFSHATELGNIHTTTKDLAGIYCQTRNIKKPIIYVTNENLLESREFKKNTNTIYSENGATAYLYIYNLKDLAAPYPDCLLIKR